jgi:hypothetical protein
MNALLAMIQFHSPFTSQLCQVFSQVAQQPTTETPSILPNDLSAFMDMKKQHA